MSEIRPRLRRRREIIGLREQPMVDSPQQSISEERRAARLRSGRHVFVEHRARPIALRLLTHRHGTGEPLIFLHEESVVRITLGHVLQHLGKSRQDPPVAARPEVLASVHRLVLGIDITAIPEIEARRRVEHDAVRIADVVINLIEILAVSRELVHLRQRRHDHVERIRPPPVVRGFGVRLIAHHLLGTRNALLGGSYLVKVYEGLETDLPVAEEHMLLVFTILFIQPLGRIFLRRSRPLVVFSPCYGIVHPCFRFLSRSWRF